MRQGHRSFWQTPHLSLFLLAALSAIMMPSIWLVPHGIGPEPVAWHLHELMFGMGGAAIGGYVLTALRSWTQQEPVAPRITVAMCTLWILARLSFAWMEQLPFVVLATGTQAYLAALAALLSWKIITLHIWPKAWLVPVVAGLIMSDLLYLARIGGFGVASAGAMEVVLTFALLICLVGGRAVPAFTRSWLERQSSPRFVYDSSVLSVLSAVALVCGGLLTVVDRLDAAGYCLMLSGALLLARMIGWQTWSACRYPALFLLHLAWIWLPTGLLLVGLAIIRPEWMPLPAAIHALTMGAMGTMILAIMARSVMARRGDMIVLDKRVALAFVLVWLSALFRVLAPFAPSGLPDPTRAVAILWMMGWSLFLWSYLVGLSHSVPRPILSARLSRRVQGRG